MIEKLYRPDLSLKDFRNLLIKKLEEEDEETLTILENIEETELNNDNEQTPIVKEARKIMYFNKLEEIERMEKMIEARELIDESLEQNGIKWW